MRAPYKATLLALAIAACLPAAAQTTRYKDWAEIEADLVEQKMLHRQVPMRDGVQLDANIYLPRGKGPFPVVLYRSPYPTDVFFTPGTLPMNDFNATLLEQGYAIVHQNERGRYWSGGEYEYLANAGEDGRGDVPKQKAERWSGVASRFGQTAIAVFLSQEHRG